MRTDPRAEEVRRLVEEVFLELSSGREGGAEEGGRRKAEGGKRKAEGGKRMAEGEGNFVHAMPPSRQAAAGPGADRPSSLRIPPSWRPSPFRRPPSALEETILIDAGRCVARSYRTAGYWAMWLIPLGLVQFYNARGEMLATINLFRSLRPARMAA
ncbi:MAG: hypothetical protein ABSF26_31000 [Thermoguttaceae bacterium]|jgi:hypothetical protein